MLIREITSVVEESTLKRNHLVSEFALVESIVILGFALRLLKQDERIEIRIRNE